MTSPKVSLRNVAIERASLVCAKCGTENPPDAQLCINPVCHAFLLAHRKSLRSGIYSRQPPPADLRIKVEEMCAGVIADRGGASELSTLEKSFIEKLGDIDVTIQLIVRDIVTNGLFTETGEVRSVYDKLLAGLAAFDRYALRIGLERRAKHIDLAAAIAAHRSATDD